MAQSATGPTSSFSSVGWVASRVLLAVLYIAAPSVLPHFMYRHGEVIAHHSHNVRAAVAGAFGLLCLIGAAIAARGRRA